MWTSRTGLAVLLLALGCAAARSDDGGKPPPDDPDPGFLEFLGGVDRLAEVNPDYLSQAGATRTGRPPGKPAPPPPPPPPPPRSLPPPSASVSGGHNE
jgi:hypothetical protein